MDSKLLPWDDDEIVFVEGDWTIERADVCGLYKYRIDGISPRITVDAAQLVEWHMAEPVRYELLLPWDGAEITLKPNAEVLRDILEDATDGKSESERGYVVESCNHLLRVNKYYLVKNGYADGSVKFTRAVSKTKAKGKFSKKCKPWVSDDIVILPTADGVVERGSAEGYYLVKQSGATRSWPAERLIEKGYAVRAYDAKLDGLCESTPITFKEYGERLCGYWHHEKPQTVLALRDIARLWYDLENKEGSAAAQWVTSHNAEVMSDMMSAESCMDVFDEKLRTFCTAVAAYVASVERCNTVISEFMQYEAKSAIDNFGEYELVSHRTKRCIDDIAEKRQAAVACGNECEAWLPPQTAENCGKLVPEAILPRGLVGKMRYIYDYVNGFDESYRAKRDDCVSRLAAEREKMNVPDQKQSTYIATYENVERTVAANMQRQRELDDIKFALRACKEFQKKPSIFRKKDKRGAISYTTGIKIDEDKFGIFEIKYNGKSFFATASELVYLGLATRN